MDSLGKSIKRALGWHWNLLAVGAGVAFAFLSGEPQLVLPLVVAAEVGYLGFLGTNARFQNILKGKSMLKREEGRERAAAAAESRATYRRLLSFLGEEDAQKFEASRTRCAELTTLQQRMSARSEGSARFRAESLDKLLWLYLKLLHQKTGISRFLQSTDRDALEAQLSRSQAELEAAREGNRSERLTSSMEDKLGTIQDRLSNYDATVENWEIVRAEIGKTEQKIAHVCEVGMTSRDPSALARQIDGISQSVSLAEEALEGLDSNISPKVNEEAPAFVSSATEEDEDPLYGTGPPPLPESE